MIPGVGSQSLVAARAAYREISLYAPDRTPCAIDLSDNTNLFGVPPAAARAVRDAAPPAVTRYPPLYAGELKRALAAYIGVRPEEVVTGCGSDDVLDSAIRAFAEPGDRLALPDPSFAMIPIFARMNAIEPVLVPLAGDLDVDADALIGERAKVTYLCSPNNPTGTAATPASVARILDRAAGIVMIDEAYGEFADRTIAPQAPRHGRLLVVRTMSKAFGLAGLRIGYAIGDASLVAEVEKSRGPYKVNALAAQAAVAALTEDRGWVDERVREVVRSRQRLTAELRSRRLEVLPSSANFLFVPHPDAPRLGARMRRRGVAVRSFADLPVVGSGLRVTLGPWTMMQTFLDALDEAIACE